jgi:hypothetical protein
MELHHVSPHGLGKILARTEKQKKSTIKINTI